MKKEQPQPTDDDMIRRADELFANAKRSAELDEMTDEELRASLAKEEATSPEDLAKHNARTRTWLAERHGYRDDNVRELLSPRWRKVLAFTPAVAAAVFAVIILGKKPWKPVEVDTTAGASGPPVQLAPAELMRLKGERACLRKEYTTCYAMLERARRLDPAGDSAPDVQAARKIAEDGIREELDR